MNSIKNQVNDLYDYNEVFLENWYSEYKDKYPDMITSFERYLKNKDDEDVMINKIKDEILLMLYNNRLITNETLENHLFAVHHHFDQQSTFLTR